MKKNLVFLMTMFLSFGLSCAFAQADFQKVINAQISYYKKMGACTPVSTTDGLWVINGKVSNYCKISTYIEINNKKYLHKECKVPLTTISTYANRKISELENGRLIFNSNDFSEYCTVVHNTIETNSKYGTMKYQY